MCILAVQEDNRNHGLKVDHGCNLGVCYIFSLPKEADEITPPAEAVGWTWTSGQAATLSAMLESVDKSI